MPKDAADLALALIATGRLLRVLVRSRSELLLLLPRLIAAVVVPAIVVVIVVARRTVVNRISSNWSRGDDSSSGLDRGLTIAKLLMDLGEAGGDVAALDLISYTLVLFG